MWSTKVYQLNLGVSDVLYGFLTYLLLGMPLLFTVSKKWFRKDKLSFLLVLYIPLLHYSIFILDKVLRFVPFLPDTTWYFNALHAGAIDPNWTYGVKMFYYFNKPINELLGGNVVVYSVYSSVLFTIALILTWKAWITATNNSVTHQPFQLLSRQIFLILAVVWPAALFYISPPLRESLILFSFALFLYGSVPNPKGRPIHLYGRYLTSILGGIGVAILRPPFAPVLLVSWFIFRINIKKNRFSIRSLKLIAYLVIFLAVGTLIILQFKIGYLFSPETLSLKRNALITKFPKYSYGAVDWDTWIEVLMDAPIFFIKLVFSPLITFPDPLQMLIGSADAIFLLIIFVIMITGMVKILKNKLQLRWLLVSIALGFSFGLYEHHAGGAVRHRMPFTLMLLPITATQLAILMGRFYSKGGKMLPFISSNKKRNSKT